MIEDEKIKESFNMISDMNPNLKEIILEREEEKTIKLHKKIRPSIIISMIAACFTLLLTISGLLIFGPLNNKSKISNVEDDGAEPVIIDSEEGVIERKYYSKAIDGGSIEYSLKDGTGVYEYSSIKGDYSEDSALDIENENSRTSGQLTCKAIFDYEAYDYFKTLISSGQETNGEFYEYYKNHKFNCLNRFKVTFDKDISLKVSLINNNKQIIYKAIPDKNGVAYLYYDANDTYYIQIDYSVNGEDRKIVESISEDKDYTLNEDLKLADNFKKDEIELMFIIDTTGSMSDELAYINSEIVSIIDGIKEKNPNTSIKLAVLLYRDTEDEYLIDYSDFTTNISKQKSFINNSSANGGGDYEEAVEVAFNESLKKNWSNNDNTKIVIHIADAPAHDDKIDTLYEYIMEFANKGIRIITVGASGISKETEYYMRGESLLTGGVYTCLTDESGIGGAHLDPTTDDDVEVELLKTCLIRLVSGIHTGSFKEAINYKEDPAWINAN